MTQQLPNSPFELDFPQSIGTFDSYPQAQRAVDFLSDQKFPVENLVIVGTDLRLMERVTGRRTWGTVVRDSAISGLGTGLFVALIFLLFLPSNPLALFAAALGLGVVISINLSLGLLTPPVGAALFAAASLSGLSPGKVASALTPYLAAAFAVLLAISLWPVL